MTRLADVAWYAGAVVAGALIAAGMLAVYYAIGGFAIRAG